MAASPPTAYWHGDGEHAYKIALRLVHDIIIHVATAYCHRRKILAHRHLILQTSCLYLFLQQLILTGIDYGRLGRLVISHRIITTERRGNDFHRLTGMTHHLRQQVADSLQGILHINARSTHLVLAQLHLQKVIAIAYSRIHRCLRIMLHPYELFVHLSECDEFLLEHHHLPIILFGIQSDFIFREITLQLRDPYSDLGELVAIDDLPSGKDRLHGRHASHDAVLCH